MSGKTVTFSLKQVIDTMFGKRTVLQYINDPHIAVLKIIKKSSYPNSHEEVGNSLGIVDYMITNKKVPSALSFRKTAQSSIPKCPTCGSTNIRPISGTERAVSVIGLGLFSKKINKTYKCLNCKHTW